MSAQVWYLSAGDTGPVLTGTLERETAPGSKQFVAEDLTGCTVALTLFRANNTTYKSGLAMTIVGDARTGRVSYAWAATDSQQGTMTGKATVTYPNGATISFPNDGPFQIRVSR